MKKSHIPALSVTQIPLVITIFFWFFVFIIFYIHTFYLHNLKAEDLSTLETERFNFLAKTNFDSDGIRNLEWENSFSITRDPNIYAKASILVDLDSGSILYEKNADEIIPPASMTKVVAMYVVFEEIASGRINLDDIVPLAPETWAINAPPDSSLMFLAQGHTVTLQEVLLGLNISSGNDAAVAVANYVSGSMDLFLERMNEVVIEVGLKKTFFVDSSGYSALNTTTAREFAEFARLYVLKYPETLELFHTVPLIAYPQEHNLPPSRIGKDFPIVQRNTNPTLGVIEGVTGLKTGYIDESGYNLSLTIERDGTRFLSVTMGGPGSNSREGNRYRILDSQAIVDFAYDNFKSASYTDSVEVSVPILGGQSNVIKARQAWDYPVTVPANATSLTRTLELPASFDAPIQQSQFLGNVVFSVDGIVVQRIPLLADRPVEESFLSISYLNYLQSLTLTAFEQ